MTRSFPRSALAAAALIVAACMPASAGRLMETGENWSDRTPKDAGPVLVAQGGCSAAAAQAAAQTGGQVLSVQTAQRGGQTVCVVTVLIPASDGNRPRRQTITIEQ